MDGLFRDGSKMFKQMKREYFIRNFAGIRWKRYNPETGEIYIPKEICNVQLTAEDKEVLRKGQAVYLENMINRKGEEFSAFVKLDMNTGTHAGRVQRAAGATYPGGGLRPCVHGAGKGEPPGRENPPGRRAEKQRADVQLLPESEPLFRTVAVFPREP